MSAARRLSGLALACVVLALVAADRSARPEGGEIAGPEVPKRIAYATALPESTGWEIAGRSCLLCHSAMLITQQAKDSTGWEKTLTQMVKWGVIVTPEERDTLRTYLLGLYGPRVPKPRPPSPAAPDSARATPAPR